MKDMFAGVLLVTALLLASSTVSSQRERSADEKPEAVKVEFMTFRSWSSGLREPLQPYSFGRPVRFQVVMTNTSSDNLLVVVYDPYHQSRPRLTKSGETIPYRPDISDLLKRQAEKQKQKNLAFYRLHFYRILEPGKPTDAQVFDLRDWYAPLAPGKYALSTRYRFDVDGQWTSESAEIKFEVVP